MVQTGPDQMSSRAWSDLNLPPSDSSGLRASVPPCCIPPSPSRQRRAVPVGRERADDGVLLVLRAQVAAPGSGGEGGAGPAQGIGDAVPFPVDDGGEALEQQIQVPAVQAG